MNKCSGEGSVGCGEVETKGIPRWNQAGIGSIQIAESVTEGGLTLHSGRSWCQAEEKTTRELIKRPE